MTKFSKFMDDILRKIKDDLDNQKQQIMREMIAHVRARVEEEKRKLQNHYQQKMENEIKLIKGSLENKKQEILQKKQEEANQAFIILDKQRASIEDQKKQHFTNIQKVTTEEIMKMNESFIESLDEIEKKKNQLLGEIDFNKMKLIYEYDSAASTIIQETNTKINEFTKNIEKELKNANLAQLEFEIERKKEEFRALTKGHDPVTNVPSYVIKKGIDDVKRMIENLKKPKKNSKPPLSEPLEPEEQSVDISNERYMPYAEMIVTNIKNHSPLNIGSPQDKSIDFICQRIINVCRTIYNDEIIEQIKGFKMCPRWCQALAILRLIDEVMNGRKKGAIGQVKTGEGKSFIIAIVGIVLAQYGRQIDVVTSTIQLAKRDQEEQKMYYDLFGISSGVLYSVHGDQEYADVQNKNDNEDFTIDAFSKTIVYSTNSNFEFVYLHSLFKMIPLRKRPYDIVIVDEVDNMLIDQASSPAIISSETYVSNIKEIFSTVYVMKEFEVDEIISSLEYLMPKYGKFDRKGITQLKRAAQESDKYIRDKDYIVKDNKVIIIDSHTGFIKIGSRWEGYIHEMIELREGLEMKMPSHSYCMITQRLFFTLYQNIIGVTGTLGDRHDRSILKKSYDVVTFEVPRNVPSKRIVKYLQRSNNIDEIFLMVENQIQLMESQRRPVLVIFEYKKDVDQFVEVFRPGTRTIEGADPSNDTESIISAGNVDSVTIATNAAGRGIDIQLSPEAIANGGLHVVIPFLPKNSRILEQNIGRSARQGQPGSATIFINGENDHFYLSAPFNEKHDFLFTTQMMFVDYLRDHQPWLFKYERRFSFPIPPFPFRADIDYVFDALATAISCNVTTDLPEEVASNYLHEMIMQVWAVFFTRLDEDDEINDFSDCYEALSCFIQKIESWIGRDMPTSNIAIMNILSRAKNVYFSIIDVIENVSGIVLKEVGTFLNNLSGGLLAKVFENKIVSGILGVVGSGLAIWGAIAAMSVGLGPLAVAQLTFAVNNLIVSSQDLVNGIMGHNEREAFNPLSAAFGGRYDNILNLTDLIIGNIESPSMKNIPKEGPLRNIPKEPPKRGLNLDSANQVRGGLPKHAVQVDGFRQPVGVPKQPKGKKVLDAIEGVVDDLSNLETFIDAVSDDDDDDEKDEYYEK